MNHTEEITAMVVRTFELEPEENISLEELRKMLAQRISYLMDKEFERLLQILYRIDVEERKTADVLSGKSVADAPLALADLVIQRQMEKIKTREEYKQ